MSVKSTLSVVEACEELGKVSEHVRIHTNALRDIDPTLVSIGYIFEQGELYREVISKEMLAPLREKIGPYLASGREAAVNDGRDQLTEDIRAFNRAYADLKKRHFAHNSRILDEQLDGLGDELEPLERDYDPDNPEGGN